MVLVRTAFRSVGRPAPEPAPEMPKDIYQRAQFCNIAERTDIADRAVASTPVFTSCARWFRIA